MDVEEETKPSIFKRTEEWFIDQDLHIYLGAITLVVVTALVWMLHTETEKNALLRAQLISMLSVDLEKDRKIAMLQAESDMNKISVTTSESRPVIETVEKASNKLNSKIEKVQNTLINAPVDPKIITKTETKTVEKPIPVDSELKAMMQQSFCVSFPEDKTCKKVKK